MALQSIANYCKYTWAAALTCWQLILLKAIESHAVMRKLLRLHLSCQMNTHKHLERLIGCSIYHLLCKTEVSEEN